MIYKKTINESLREYLYRWKKNKGEIIKKIGISSEGFKILRRLFEKQVFNILKDSLKKENISEIKIKNQSIQNNTNSISRSFDSDKNDNNKEKEKIFINPINNKKESKFNKKKEEIKNMLINHENNKYKNQKRKNGIIQRANKKPELEPHSKYNFNETLKKLKNN